MLPVAGLMNSPAGSPVAVQVSVLAGTSGSEPTIGRMTGSFSALV